MVPASRVLRPCAWWSFGRQVTKVPGPRAGRPWDARLASGQLVGTAYSAGRKPSGTELREYNDPAIAIAWLLGQGAERIAYVDAITVTACGRRSGMTRGC